MPDTHAPIVVLNPNSTEAVTAGLDRALEPLRMAGGPGVACETLAEGPPGIESEADVAAVIDPICRFVRDRGAGSGAFVVACFSDPGLAEARRVSARPVFGMAESGYLTALTRGRRFGVISILGASIPRHRAYIERIGLASRLAGDRAIEMGVVALGDEAAAFERMREVGAALRDEDGADVLLLGCAGMAAHKRPLEDALGVAVIEPVQAAVTMAFGAALTAAA